MKLENIALIFAIIFGVVWVLGYFIAALTMPFALGLIPLAAILYLFFRVLRDRLNNAEDDHYEQNVER